MLWRKVRRSDHYELYHKNIMSWSDVVHTIYSIKNKRQKGNKIRIENERFYILCELKADILYVINVKVKNEARKNFKEGFLNP